MEEDAPEEPAEAAEMEVDEAAISVEERQLMQERLGEWLAPRAAVGKPLPSPAGFLQTVSGSVGHDEGELRQLLLSTKLKPWPEGPADLLQLLGTADEEAAAQASLSGVSFPTTTN
jgi:hypothetical protein